MKVLVYSRTQRGQAERLVYAIEKIVPSGAIHICHSIQSLSLWLCQPGPPPEVTVLLAATRKDLSEILSIQGLLTDIRLILILPDKREDTVSKGHSLYPRFLSYTDGDYADVAAVLQRMLSIAPGSAHDEAGEGRLSSAGVSMKDTIVLH
jgi:hypothetical protein